MINRIAFSHYHLHPWHLLSLCVLCCIFCRAHFRPEFVNRHVLCAVCQRPACCSHCLSCADLLPLCCSIAGLMTSSRLSPCGQSRSRKLSRYVHKCVPLCSTSPCICMPAPISLRKFHSSQCQSLRAAMNRYAWKMKLRLALTHPCPAGVGKSVVRAAH